AFFLNCKIFMLFFVGHENFITFAARFQTKSFFEVLFTMAIWITSPSVLPCARVLDSFFQRLCLQGFKHPTGIYLSPPQKGTDLTTAKSIPFCPKGMDLATAKSIPFHPKGTDLATAKSIPFCRQGENLFLLI
ncbi:MAG: hypothetical protein LBS94_05625, partial [Prevotellaceae bacterium]|nr:hypothetical protein [Prevotellaceae bacterium]